VVEDIEGLGAELQLRSFGQSEPLENREVCLPVGWPTQAVATGVAELVGPRHFPGRSRPHAAYEPAVAVLVARVRIARPVGPARASVGARAGRKGRRKRQAALPGGRRVDLPAANEKVERARDARQVFSPFADGYVPDLREDEDVGAIKARRAVDYAAIMNVLVAIVSGRLPGVVGQDVQV
jgi:hypothetical protein